MIKRRRYPAQFSDLFSRRDLLKRAGKFEYCFQMSKQGGLTKKDMFVLKPDGKKAIQRKTKDSGAVEKVY